MKNAAGELLKCYFPYQLHVNKPWLFTVNTGPGKSSADQSDKTVSKPGLVQMQQVVSEEIAEENHNEEKIICKEVKLKYLKAIYLIFYFTKMKKGVKV